MFLIFLEHDSKSGKKINLVLTSIHLNYVISNRHCDFGINFIYLKQSSIITPVVLQAILWHFERLKNDRISSYYPSSIIDIQQAALCNWLHLPMRLLNIAQSISFHILEDFTSFKYWIYQLISDTKEIRNGNVFAWRLFALSLWWILNFLLKLWMKNLVRIALNHNKQI